MYSVELCYYMQTQIAWTTGSCLPRLALNGKSIYLATNKRLVRELLVKGRNYIHFPNYYLYILAWVSWALEVSICEHLSQKFVKPPPNRAK